MDTQPPIPQTQPSTPSSAGRPRRNWNWKRFILFCLLLAGVIVLGGYLLLLLYVKLTFKWAPPVPDQPLNTTSASPSNTPVFQDNGIPITANTVNFARINNKIYLQYKGKVYDQDEKSEPKEIQMPNADTYTWYGLVDIPPATQNRFDEIFSFKVAPGKDNFVFVMRYDVYTAIDKFDQYLKTYYYDRSKQGNKVIPLLSSMPYNKDQEGKYNFPKISEFSNDGKYVSFDMYGCWNCGGHQPEKLVMNLTTGISKNIGKVSYFAWKDKGNYEYKDYIPEPCPTPIGVKPGEYMESECPKDPQTLPMKTGQI